MFMQQSYAQWQVSRDKRLQNARPARTSGAVSRKREWGMTPPVHSCLWNLAEEVAK